MHYLNSFQTIFADKLRRTEQTQKSQKSSQKSSLVLKSSCHSSPSINSWKLVDHAILLTSQATILTLKFLAHHISGPRKPSWPTQLTLMCTAIRTFTEHIYSADMDKLRSFINILFSLVPSDILVTPVSFRVSNESLPCILGGLEDSETDRREISGEWVVPKDLWRKINDDYFLNASIQQHVYVDQNGIKWSNEKVVLYLHGGAYCFMSARTHRDLNYRLSRVTGRRVFAINYRLAPEGPFPCGLHDAIHSFLYLTDPNGLAIQPQNIVVAGDGAGGGLVLAMLYYLRDNQMALPGGAVLFSPWVDLTMSCASWDQNRSYDYLFKQNDVDPLHPVNLYLDFYEERSKLITHPYVSPLFGDLHNLPPLLIQCGDSEVLRDEIYLLAHKASETGTTFVRHEVYEDMVHAFQMFNFLESSVKAMNSVGHFVRTVIPIHQKATSRPQASHREYTPFVPRLPPTIRQQNAEWSFTNSFEQLLIPRSQISVGHEKPACTECDELSVLRTSISSIMGYPHFTPIPLKTPIETTNFTFHNPNLLLSQQREYSSPQNPSTPPARFTHIQNQTHVSLNNRRHQRIESQGSQPTINPLRSSRCSVLKQLYLDYNEHPAVNTNFVKINGTTDEFINSDVNCNYNIEYDSELDGDGNDDGRSIHSVDVSVYTGSYFGE